MGAIEAERKEHAFAVACFDTHAKVNGRGEAVAWALAAVGKAWAQVKALKRELANARRALTLARKARP